MDVIEEIKREKELRQQQHLMVKDIKDKKHAEVAKDQATQFKQVRNVLRKKQLEDKAKHD